MGRIKTSHKTSEEESAKLIQSIRKSLVRLTQWALTLQEVYEERETIGLLHPESFNCNCKRALDINQHLSELELIYIDAIDNDKIVDSKVGDNKTDSKSLKELNQKQL